MSNSIGVRARRVMSASVLAAGVLGSSPALAASQHLGQRLLRPGMRGHDVRVLQDFLTRTGFRTKITGVFDSPTESHVVSFERRYHLQRDGIVGPQFVRTIRKAVAAKSSTSSDTAVATSGGAGFTPPAGNGPVEKATLNSQGLAIAPPDAPQVIVDVIAAANKIAFKPYVYGGGHGSFTSSGYDCSGSVSYALHGGRLLSSPLDSSSLESWGRSGRGRWITVWANSGHTFMYIAGLRFDTSAQSSNHGDRWTTSGRSSSGYVVRHPAGW